MNDENLFFVYRDQIPEGVGFEHFSLSHILFLVFIVAFIVTVSLIYKKSSVNVRKVICHVVAWTIVAMEVFKQFLCYFTGVYEPGLIPLHLCGMSIFMIAIHAIKPNKFTGEYIYSLSIPGATMALLFADWTMYPIWNIFCLQSFLIHMLQITFPFMLLAAGELKPAVKNLWMPSLYLLIVVPPIYFLNKVLDTNFFFMNEAAADSPLSFLQSFLGNPGYIFGTVGILAIIWVIMYTPLVIANRLHKKNDTDNVDFGRN